MISSETYKKENTKITSKNLEETKSTYNFYKKNESDIIWWIDNENRIGEHLFSFDKKKIYNLFRDYPYELTEEEKEIFNKENPYWADYFKDRFNTPQDDNDYISFKDIIDELVNKISSLPKGTEISLSSILGDKVRNYETSDLFKINKRVLSACKEKGIILNFDKYKNQIVGLPFNIPFTKE